MTTSEQSAVAVGNSRKLLRIELNRARSVLRSDLRKSFGKGRFDFDKKQLVGDNGLILQWLLRSNPGEPESYLNQQADRGTVIALMNAEKGQL